MDVLKFFKSLVKTETVRIDNCIFKLHYRFTVALLIISSILITSKQFFGDPINCEIDGVSSELYDSYCWIYSTYTVKKTSKSDILPGLGHVPDRKLYKFDNPVDKIVRNPLPDEELTHHKYYQWICITLWLQALLFYIPRYIWKTWEAGRLRLLTRDLGGPLLTANWNDDTKIRLVSYIVSGRSSHNIYAIRFLLCEFFNLVNVMLQIFTIDWILNHKFSGLYVLLEILRGHNVMAEIFPKLAKCTYYRYGSSGSIESRDGLCVLPLNVFNEKLYLIMWFWFYILWLLTTIALIFRVVFFCVPHVRMYLLMARTKYLNKEKAKLIVENIGFGNCFILYQLGKNLNPTVFKDLVLGINNVLNHASKMKIYSTEVAFPT